MDRNRQIEREGGGGGAGEKRKGKAESKAGKESKEERGDWPGPIANLKIVLQGKTYMAFKALVHLEDNETESFAPMIPFSARFLSLSPSVCLSVCLSVCSLSP